MGYIIQTEGDYEYRHDSGETTAWFESVEEKTVLAHKGSSRYKKIFYVLIIAGVLYLAAVFVFVH